MNLAATGTYNIGCGKNYSINEVAALVGGPAVHIEPRLGEARLTLADYSKAKEVLGWQPNIDLPTGLSVLDKFEKKSNLIIF